MAKKCACIRGNYDFSINQERCDSITYIDHSTFQTGAEYSSTPSYSLTITTPSGVEKSYTVTVGTPLHLDFGSCPEQGVWEASVESCTEKFSKRFAVTCLLRCGYLKLFNKVKDPEVLSSIRERIDMGELLTSTDYVTAIKIFQSVERDIARWECQCVCG